MFRKCPDTLYSCPLFTFSCSSCVFSDFFPIQYDQRKWLKCKAIFAHFKFFNIKIFLIAVAFSCLKNTYLSLRWLYLGYNSQFFTVPHHSYFSYTLIIAKLVHLKVSINKGVRFCKWPLIETNTSENRSTTNNQISVLN